MPKKILVRESGLLDFFQSFFQAKSKGKESDWLQRLRKADPKLANVWSNYDSKLSASIQQQKRDLQSLGLDTSKVDAMIKKYGLKNI